MVIFDALKKDHDKVKELLERLVHSADADDTTRKNLIYQIRDELIPHSRAEEAVFYNSLSTIEGTRGLVAEGYTEHMGAEALLRTLQAMDAMDANWAGVARKLKDALEHHIAEEEGEIFSAARQVLAPEEADMMGQAFEEMKVKIGEPSVVKSTVELFVNMMPQRFAEPLRNYIHRS